MKTFFFIVIAFCCFSCGSNDKIRSNELKSKNWNSEIIDILQGDWFLSTDSTQMIHIKDKNWIEIDEKYGKDVYDLVIEQDSSSPGKSNVLLVLYSGSDKYLGFYLTGIDSNEFSLMSNSTGEPLVYFR